MKSSNSKQKRTRRVVPAWIVVTIVVIGGVVVGFVMLQLNNMNSISSFQGCKDAGGTVAESYPEQCFINGKSFFNEAHTITPSNDEYIGLTEQEAFDKASKMGKASRVVERDGESLTVTMDYAPGRLNFKVKSGKIYKVGVE